MHSSFLPRIRSLCFDVSAVVSEVTPGFILGFQCYDSGLLFAQRHGNVTNRTQVVCEMTD